MAQTKQRKVALMGFRSVGKSSLAIQFVQVSQTWSSSFISTLKFLHVDISRAL